MNQVNNITIKTLLFQSEFFIEEITSGKIFIYPTDTVYGIGCDASNGDAVKKIFKIKQRENKPFLIIVPSKEWIFENCEMSAEQKTEIENKLPGAYSFIVKLKQSTLDNNLISKELLCGKDTIGVRIPDSKISELIKGLNKPFVTTSVNISGESAALKLEDIKEEIISKVDYVITSNENLSGIPSQIYDLSNDEIKQLR